MINNLLTELYISTTFGKRIYFISFHDMSNNFYIFYREKHSNSLDRGNYKVLHPVIEKLVSERVLTSWRSIICDYYKT